MWLKTSILCGSVCTFLYEFISAACLCKYPKRRLGFHAGISSTLFRRLAKYFSDDWRISVPTVGEFIPFIPLFSSLSARSPADSSAGSTCRCGHSGRCPYRGFSPMSVLLLAPLCLKGAPNKWSRTKAHPRARVSVPLAAHKALIPYGW